MSKRGSKKKKKKKYSVYPVHSRFGRLFNVIILCSMSLRGLNSPIAFIEVAQNHPSTILLFISLHSPFNSTLLLFSQPPSALSASCSCALSANSSLLRSQKLTLPIAKAREKLSFVPSIPPTSLTCTPLFTPTHNAHSVSQPYRLVKMEDNALQNIYVSISPFPPPTLQPLF